jgi:hypothetical protein
VIQHVKDFNQWDISDFSRRHLIFFFEWLMVLDLGGKCEGDICDSERAKDGRTVAVFI